MRKTTLHIRIGVISICLLALCVTAAMALTPAGTQINAASSAQYYSTSGSLMPTAASNTVTTTVGQVGAVSVSPTSTNKTNTPGSPIYFPVTVTNSGNGSDTINLSTFSSNGSSVKIYKDDNGDGTHQSTETTVPTSTGALAAGGTYKVVVSVQLTSTATTDTVTLTATSQLDSTKSAKATLSVGGSTPPPSTGYIQNWLLNLPYSNSDSTTRLSKDYLNGEATVLPTQGVVTGLHTWKLYNSLGTTAWPSASVTDLGYASGTLYNAPSPTSVAGYAHVYINSPSAQSAQLWLGSDNGVKAWVNGSVVWTNDSTRGYTADQDKVNINLAAGWNRLLIKVSQYGGSWCFSAKICTSSGGAVSGLTYQTNPPITTATVAPSPVISNVTLGSAGSSSATITWTTDQSSSTLVDYGTTTSFGTSYSDASLTTSHTASLTGLLPTTTYYLRVGSANSSGAVTWMNTGLNFTTQASGSGTTPTPATNPYITSWLMNGPYTASTGSVALSTDFLGGEASVSPLSGSAGPSGSTWTSFTSSADTTDLGKLYGNPSNCIGYAFAYIYSPAAQSQYLALGSGDGIKVWLNGQSVFTLDTSRACVDGANWVPINLNAGWNRLLVKVSENTYAYGGWQFMLEPLQGNAAMIPGLAYSLSPQ